MLNSKIIKVLEQNFGCELLSESAERELKRFKFITEGTEFADEKCLYIGSIGNKENISSSATILTTEKPDRIKDGQTVIYAPAERLYECLNEISEQFAKQQNKEDLFDLFKINSIELGTLKDVLNRGSEFFDRSLLITDLGFRVIEYSDTKPVTDKYWLSNIASGGVAYEIVSKVNEYLSNNPLPESAKSFYVNCDYSNEKAICSRFYYKGRSIGYLLLLDNGKGILPKHLEYLTKFSEMLSQITDDLNGKADRFISAKELTLLNILEKSENVLINEKFDLKAGEQVKSLVIFPKVNSPHDLYYLRNNLKNLFPNEIIFVHDNYIVALLPVKDIPAFEKYSNQADLIKFIKRIGISLSFKGISEFSMQTDYAKKACEIAEQIGSAEKICRCERFMFLHILNMCGDKELLYSYIHPALKKLHVYDLSHNTQLFETLWTFLNNEMKQKETSEKLFLHRNTLNYRLNRIKELTDLSWDNTEEVVHLYSSFSIWYLLNKYTV